MIQAIDTWVGKGKDTEIDAVCTFLKRGLENREHFSALLNHKGYGEQLSSGSPKVSFYIKGSRHKIVFDSTKVRASLSTASSIASEAD